MDYYRGPNPHGTPMPNSGPSGCGPGMFAPSAAPVQAPQRYFNANPSHYSQSLSPSQRSSDRSQGSLERTKRRGKNLRKQGTLSQGSAYSSQNYMQQLMSQESYTAFDDFGLTSQESQTQNTQNTQDL